VIATGFQAAWAKARELEHQEQFSHQEQGVQTTNQQHGEDQIARGQDEFATAVGSTSPIAHG
jgi:hypothetical protein